ncbi:hypothetical protein [Polluticoccus soli]|uniref:hypothetical protein n=1 Tax=Polluticoccus soli TaxID=3034150 RepID=UPI0023E32A99|nr:hypothetical protein [Flavipsychrobacter sp. JY13-12]
MSTGTIYFTFPIAIFKDAFRDIKKCCNNALLYAAYELTTEMESGTDEEMMEAAAGELEIIFGDYEIAYEAGEELYDEHNGTPMTSISSQILFDYKNEKTEFEIACFLGFAAFRSILQTKPYCKTNKAHIHARMCGYASVKTLPKELPEIEQKYAARYHMDKVIRHLELNWYLKTFSNHTRGIYFGFDKTSLEALALVNEQAKKKTKEAQLKQAKADALAKAKTSLNGSK